jgi:hypothetical protein
MAVRFGIGARGLAAAAFALAAVTRADVLPDDRADVMWDHWQGGGEEVQGPSVLVRKKFGDSLSIAANYYIDMISSASVDVLSTASPYKETRTQESLSADYLNGKTTYSLGYIQSNELDYHSKTAYFSVSESMFGDLTTVSFGGTLGWDQVYEHIHTPTVNVYDFKGDADRRNWQASVSQVLTRNLLLSMNFETGESDGYLQSPYRSARYLASDGTVQAEAEVYPDVRTGNAAALQLKYYLPWHAALGGSYRFYKDTWGIVAHTFGLDYTQPLFTSWTLNGRARYYRQGPADFYSDLFPYEDSQNFMARDRELAEYHDITLGATATWEFHPGWPRWIEKGTMNLSYDRMSIDYADFRNYGRTGGSPIGVPLYSYDANITQFFISVWY